MSSERDELRDKTRRIDCPDCEWSIDRTDIESHLRMAGVQQTPARIQQAFGAFVAGHEHFTDHEVAVR